MLIVASPMLSIAPVEPTGTIVSSSPAATEPTKGSKKVSLAEPVSYPKKI